MTTVTLFPLACLPRSSLDATALAASDLYNVCVVDSGSVSVGDVRSATTLHARGGAPSSVPSSSLLSSPRTFTSTAVMAERPDEFGGQGGGGEAEGSRDSNKCMKCRERTLTKGQRIYLENKFGETGKKAQGSIEVCRPCYNHEKGYGRMREPQRVRYLVDCASRILETVEREASATERKRIAKALGRAVSFTHKALHIEFKSRGNKSKKTLEKERSGKDDAEKVHTKAKKALEDFEEPVDQQEYQLPPPQAAFPLYSSSPSGQLPAPVFSFSSNDTEPPVVVTVTATATVEKQGAREQAIVSSQLKNHEDLFPATNTTTTTTGLDTWESFGCFSDNEDGLVLGSDLLDDFDFGNFSDFDPKLFSKFPLGAHGLSDNESGGLSDNGGGEGFDNLEFDLGFDSDSFSTRRLDDEEEEEKKGGF